MPDAGWSADPGSDDQKACKQDYSRWCDIRSLSNLSTTVQVCLEQNLQWRSSCSLTAVGKKHCLYGLKDFDVQEESTTRTWEVCWKRTIETIYFFMLV